MSAKHANSRLNNTDFKELYSMALETLGKFYKINELLLLNTSDEIQLFQQIILIFN